jgi:uncharacterized membrane protein YhaH (DUF805 family)
VSFVDAIKTVFGKYADFEGRATRPEFWWWFLFTVLVSGALNVFSVIPVGESSSVGAILSGLWSIGTLLPTLAVGVRRLRDAGYVWQNIFWILLPLAGLIVLVIYWAKPTAPGPSTESTIATTSA